MMELCFRLLFRGVSWVVVATQHSGLSIVVEGLEGFSGAQWLRRLLPYWGCWAQQGGYGVYALKVHVIFVMATESERPECVVSNSQQNMEVNLGFVEDLALDKNLSCSWDAWNLIEKTHASWNYIINFEPFFDYCCGGLIEDETTPQDRWEVNKEKLFSQDITFRTLFIIFDL